MLCDDDNFIYYAAKKFETTTILEKAYLLVDGRPFDDSIWRWILTSADAPADKPSQGSKHGSYWFMGDIITINATALDTHGIYSLIEITVPGGHEIPVHMHHKEDEGFLVLEGNFSFKSGDKTIYAKQGDYNFLIRGIPHNFKNEGMTPGRLLAVITPPGFDQFFAEVGTKIENMTAFKPPVGSPPDIGKLTEIAQKYQWQLMSFPPQR